MSRIFLLSFAGYSISGFTILNVRQSSCFRYYILIRRLLIVFCFILW